MIRDPVWALVNPHYEMKTVTTIIIFAIAGALLESATK